MSHEIETHGTQAAAVFARKDAWHRLGTTVRDRAFTAEEAMRVGHLGGWDVRKLPLTTAEVSEGGVTPIEVPGFATVRTNPFTGVPEALGVVGGGYTPLQNEDHAEFLNLLADESRLFVFADGPKTDADKPKVEQVRRMVNEISGFKSVKVVERDENMGLAASIISGVSMLVNEYGKVIVFEDDLLSSAYTLQYFNQALSRYEREPQVMHIGAYMFGLDDKDLPQTFFHHIATSWGWATWARAWSNFEPDINTLLQQFDAAKKQRFSVENTMNFWRQMQEFKAGKNNSWAIRWYASIFLKGGLSLNPARSLVHNIGHDGTGTHSNIEDMYRVQITNQPVTHFPDVIEVNPQAHAAIKNFLKNRKGTLLQRGMRFINQLKAKYVKG